jgi:hypothetical protein
VDPVRGPRSFRCDSSNHSCVFFFSVHRKKRFSFIYRWAGSHTWRICPSLQAIRPLEGSLCHCLEPQVGHLRRPGVIEAHRNIIWQSVESSNLK